MTHRPEESLDQLRARVERLEKPSKTSPTFSKFGWPILGVGLLLWAVSILSPGWNFLVALPAMLLTGVGAVAIVMKFISEHSEGVEERERDRLIRERSDVARCLYLEGKVPEGKGTVGRCRLYEFDMVDHPYCLYCREFTPSKGKPEV